MYNINASVFCLSVETHPQTSHRCWCGIGLIGSTLEKPRLQCKPQIVFSFTIKNCHWLCFCTSSCVLLLFKQWSTNHNSWCGIGYSKPYALRHLSLNQMCLPIPPIPHIVPPLFVQPTATGSEYEDYRIDNSLFRKYPKENSSSCTIVFHNQAWPTNTQSSHVIVFAAMLGVPCYPTFTGLCNLVLFHWLWINQLSVRVSMVSQLKTKTQEPQ